MKNTFLTAAAILALSVAANAQNTTTTQPSTSTQTPTTQPATTQPVQPAQTVQPAQPVQPATTVAPSTSVSGQTTISTQTARPMNTADSIHAKYQYLPMPQAWSVDKTFPVIGTYQLNGADATAANLSIALDSASKGIVWISGLPQGTVKAYLAKSPATYRIIPQKTAEGKSVPEGTLVFSPETNTLNIALGAPFNAADPVAIFPVVAPADSTAVNAAIATAPAVATVKVKQQGAKSKSKSKSKVTYYTATKVNALNNTGSNAAFGQQLQSAEKQQ